MIILIFVTSSFQNIYIMSTNQAHLLWKSQLPSLDRIVAKCARQVTKSLSRFHPAQFGDRVQQFKDLLQKYDDRDKTECTLEYMDVIADFIEGKKNKSLIQLANELKIQFGGDSRYWLNTIQTVAEKINYADQLQVWQLRKPFEERLFMDAEDLSNFRQFTKITKKYMASIKNLTKLIRKFDPKKDSINKIDEMYKKLKKSEEKYITFGESAKLFQRSQTLDDLSNNISQVSKNNAKKTLFNYQKTSKKNEQIQQKTLLHYMKVEKPILERVHAPKSNIFVTQQMIKGERLKQFEDNLKDIKINSIDFNELRKDFMMSKVNKNPPEDQNEEEELNYISIYDKDYFFSYDNFPIQNNENISYSKPFESYDFIDYQVYSEQQFQELLGDDIDKESEVSEATSLTSNSFEVSDGHLSDEEEYQKTNKGVKFNLQTFFGEPWSFSLQSESKSKKHKKYNYEMIPLARMICGQIPLISEEEIAEEKVLTQIVDGKDKKSIMGELSKRGFSISKGKVEDFLKKNCIALKQENSKGRASGKSIYKIINQISSDSPENKSMEQRKSKNRNRNRFEKTKRAQILTDNPDESEDEGNLSQTYSQLSDPIKITIDTQTSQRITRQKVKDMHSQ